MSSKTDLAETLALETLSSRLCKDIVQALALPAQA